MTSESKLLRAYSAPPFIYDLRGFFILTFSYRSTLWQQVSFFGKNIGKRHLDIAVGTGTLLFIIYMWRKITRKSESKIVAIDYVPSMLEGGNKYFKHNPHVHLEVGDATQLKFESNSFDTVNMANAFHCISNIDAALVEVYRVLKPGGIFAVNILLYPKGKWPFKQIAEKINMWGIKKGILYTPYNKEDVRKKIIERGFELVFEKISGNSYNLLIKKPATLFK